jgi:alkylresorcinol/alkylpyrone synthase
MANLRGDTAVLDELNECDIETELQLKPAVQTVTPPTPAVDILSLATATPDFKMSQKEAFERVKRITPHLARLEGIYTSSAIETRYSCVSPDWCEQPHGWEERMLVFRREAMKLLEKVAVQAVAEAGLEIDDIDVLVTNTTTGIAVPSFDAMLINRLNFKETITRLPIFGFGCSGGAAGLARASQLAQAMPGANVLFVTFDLCSLAVRSNDHSLTNFVAAALFGDGAAGIVLRSPNRNGRTGQKQTSKPIARLVATGEHFLYSTENHLGLDVRDDGFGMVLSAQMPALVRENLNPAVSKFLKCNDMSLSEFDGYLIHAGGRKILEAVGEILGTSPDQMQHAWSVMRDYGNMSSATVLFVLQRALAAKEKGRHLLAAFGFGFSAHFAVIDL